MRAGRLPTFASKLSITTGQTRRKSGGAALDLGSADAALRAPHRVLHDSEVQQPARDVRFSLHHEQLRRIASRWLFVIA
jgi:hypothetical protein